MYKHLTPQEIEEFEAKSSTGVFGAHFRDEDPDWEAILSFIDTLIGKRELDKTITTKE